MAHKKQSPGQIALGIIIWIVVLVVINNIFCSNNDTLEGTSWSNSGSSNSNKTNSPEKATPTFAIGETFTLGKYQYHITHVKRGSAIGTKYNNTKASDGAVFVAIYYTIENIDNETHVVALDDFILVDWLGRRFDASSNANTQLSFLLDYKGLFSEQLQPGLMRKMVTAYEVPTQVLENAITFEIPEKGIWNTGISRVVVKPDQITDIAR
ncbi:DUF4352 domain-containing protein [bacterium]|nr:DUF4352 domain-containing protein [bacterium]